MVSDTVFQEWAQRSGGLLIIQGVASLEELFARFGRTGDPEALGEVYDRVAARLLRSAMHLASSAAAAEDLVQATFVAAIERRDSYDAARPLLPWLMGILANQAKLQRGRERREPDPLRLAQRVGEDPLQGAEHAEFTAAVDDAIAALPEVYQPVLVLHLRHGLAPADIAHALRRPPGTVRAQLARGLEKLRTALPAGLAGTMLAMAVPARGLAAVREVVLAKAVSAIPAAVSAGGLAGGIMVMKKLALGVAAASVAAAVFLWETGPSDLAPAAPDGSVTAEPSVAMPPPTGLPPPESPSLAGRTAVEGEKPAIVIAPTPAPGHGLLEGTVLWGDGEPAASVAVWCSSPLAGPGDLLHTVTGANGRFHFPDLAAGSYGVGADRGGYTAVVIGAADRRDVEIVIPPGCRLTGLARTPDGVPIPGARIWLSQRHHLESGRAIATTDDQGRFEVRSVGSEHYVGARADDYRPSTLFYVQGEPGETVELDLVLHPGAAALRGIAFDSDGQPIEGALVRISPPGRSPWVAEASSVSARAWAPVTRRTERNGEFAADGLPPGDLTVQVRARDHGTFRGELTVAAGSVGQVTATLPKQAIVTGRVTDPKGDPVVGAIVRAGTAWDDFALARTVTDSGGAFDLRDVTPGSARLAVLVGNDVAQSTELTLGPGQTARWNPVLYEKPSIRGVVVDARREPLAGWRVDVRRDGEFLTMASTDDHGQFEITGLTPAPHELLASFQPKAHNLLHQGGIVAAVLDGVCPGQGPVAIEIPADRMPSCRVIGTVVGPEGGVVTQTRVVIGNQDGHGSATIKVDAETGDFAVDRIVPGPYWITVRADGHPWIRVGSRVLEPGQTLDLGELAFAASAAVAGTLRHENGGRVEGVEASITDAGGLGTGAVELTGERFRSSPLQPGDYRLLVSGTGIAAATVPFRITAGQETSLDVLLRRGARRSIRASLPAGVEVRYPWLSLMRGEESLVDHGLKRQGDGTYTSELWLGPGSYVVRIGCREGYRGHVQVEVDAGLGGAPTIEVELTKR